ncbi:MAG: SO_0444 family Cu/Zn efflux transporter [Desulfobacterales bacterium]
MDILIKTGIETWHILLDSSFYIILGLIISGLIRIFLSPETTARHFGRKRFGSVFKAAIVGIPLPLCSCGVLPTAVSLKKQGANNGAATAFMISTPESGVDSIALTYALLDPLMAAARPVAAFFSAITAGLLENIFWRPKAADPKTAKESCTIDGCCNRLNCPPEIHSRHHTSVSKISAGMRFAFTDVWKDMASWFALGLLLAGFIMAFIPEEAISRYLGGGMVSMLIMLVMGVPVYICATASTPIAAALILKGVSPGAALVFLLAGPATNITSLTVLFGILGKRATAIYLGTIAVFSVGFGILLDFCYTTFDISAQAIAGSAAEIIPAWLEWTGAVILILLSVKPIYHSIRNLVLERIIRRGPEHIGEISCSSTSCGCEH